MAKTRELMALGLPAETAKAVGIGTINAAVTAAGTTIADATILTASSSLCTSVGANTGVKPPPDCDIGDVYEVANGGANALKVYPDNSANKINNGAAGASV